MSDVTERSTHTGLFIMNINSKIIPRKAVAYSQIHFGLPW